MPNGFHHTLQTCLATTYVEASFIHDQTAGMSVGFNDSDTFGTILLAQPNLEPGFTATGNRTVSTNGIVVFP